MRNLVYILASSYSGSTLLTLLMASHPRISTIGELKASAMGDIDKYVCSCGMPIRECGFWKKVKQQMTALGADFDLENFRTHFRADSPVCDRLLRAGVRGRFLEIIRDIAIRFSPRCRHKFETILQQNRALIEVICGIQGGDIFLDGSKEPIRLKHLILGRCWNIKVIYLIRDGRGETNSYMRHYGVPMEVAAKEWVRTHVQCKRIIGQLVPKAWLVVHYEDLCKDLNEIMRQIYEFIGVDPGQGIFEYRSSEQHILGNAMRLKPLGEILIDEKWKQDLTNEELRVFGQIAGPMNLSYGYK